MIEHPCRLDVRLSQAERDRLKEQCDHFGMSQTDYMRMLINMPAALLEDSAAEPADVVVVDRFSTFQLARQVRHWGYLYNQAVHSLNSLAYYDKQDEVDIDDLVYVLRETNRKLDQINEAMRIVSRRLDSMVGAHYGIAFSETTRQSNNYTSVLNEKKPSQSDGNGSL